MSGVRVTVGELITRLMDFPADTMVVVEAPEGGFDPVRVGAQSVYPSPRLAWGEGEWRSGVRGEGPGRAVATISRIVVRG